MDAVTSRTTAWRWTRKDWVIAAAALSSAFFIALIAGPALAPAGAVRHAGHLAILYLHIGGGTVMLLAGAAGLRIGLTRQGFGWHRRVGFTYLVGGTLASISALIRSFDTQHTPGLSTGTLALTWLAFTAMAWRAIRNRRVEQHREWMIRSYVVAWTFVFCRFYTRAMPSDLQGGTNDMIWLTWIAPVLMTEVILQWRRGAELKGAPS
ncbi:DUF2306 domain-containing protein [Sphingomonas sp. ID1715]|uniref:DUF2306 domain-containing protein n=1 Tax=Sphingomonas sp. ID1715 TaxID=1656898 RepID=UPI001489A422|nr:DUF2306 domain-containing protein [Sphingomonas sp. ID1715]NNM77181.1 DUF2306 domain-containing protein [Sphingomonas sp. ID1715]